MIKAIIFDCFGVLISDALEVVVNDVRARDPRAADHIRDLVRASNKGLIDPNESNRQIAEILDVDLADYQATIRNGEVKDQNVLDFVRELRGTYKTAMLSNISATGIHKRFSDAELREYFDTVVTSGDIGYAKPEPEAYEIVADRLNVRLDECVFTDDRLDFCEAAQGVGMKGIEFQNLDQFKQDLAAILTEQ